MYAGVKTAKKHLHQHDLKMCMEVDNSVIVDTYFPVFFLLFCFFCVLIWLPVGFSCHRCQVFFVWASYELLSGGLVKG